MSSVSNRERIETVVIGGGQAGLSVGYHLKQLGKPFVILDASERIGDAWRKRWDSLRLFSPASLSGLDGMPHRRGYEFISKDEMADYLETYAATFALPVRSGARVESLTREGTLFVVRAGQAEIEAENVIVAMADYQKPKVPEFAPDLSPDIVQMHSSSYRNLQQLKPGGVLLVGAGNSGAELAAEMAASHPTWLSGRDTGHIPFNIEGRLAKLFLARLVLRGVFHRVLTVKTPMGRKMRPKVLSEGGPLIRTRGKELTRLGVQRAPRTVGIRGGQPVLEDGRVLDVANVIWCTGFQPGFTWIKLPGFEHGGQPAHVAGVVESEPGLFFVGLEFLYSMSSVMIHGVGRDAKRIATVAAQRSSRPAVTTREDAVAV